MSDIVERLREGCGCNFPETTCMAESECADAFEAADTITALRAENEKLRAAITVAIRQHEEGNKGLAHRTLCEAVYGRQA